MGSTTSSAPDAARRAATYELPDDVFFEVTGILQVVPAALAGWHLSRMPQRTERRMGASMASEQPHGRDNRRG